LMASTPSAYPQVLWRRFASSPVVESSVFPAQGHFCAWFDSRQLHREEAGQGQKPWPAFFFGQVIERRNATINVASSQAGCSQVFHGWQIGNSAATDC
jgi:hypothetical protein